MNSLRKTYQWEYKTRAGKCLLIYQNIQTLGDITYVMKNSEEPSLFEFYDQKRKHQMSD